MTSVDDCVLIDLPTRHDARGGLVFVERGAGIAFDIQRVYYLYDIPPGAERGAHGHKKLEQLFIAIAGSFDVVLDDGRGTKSVRLSDPGQGLYICPMIWRDLKNFSPGAVCMVLASARYDEGDYFREYGDFLTARGVA